MPSAEQHEAGPDDAAGPAVRRPRLPATSATANIVSDSGASDRPASSALYSSDHLQEDRQRDHRAAERDLLQHLAGDAEPEVLRAGTGPGRRRVGLPARLRRTSHQASDDKRHGADGDQKASTSSPPSCQTRMPRTTPPMPSDRQDRADHVDLARRRCTGRPWTSRMPDQHDGDDHDLEPNPTRHDRKVVTKPPRSGPMAAAIAAAAPTSA